MKITVQGWFSSLSGIIVAVMTLLGITGAAFASGGAIFNPGSLSIQSGPPLGGVVSHSEIQQCSACHASPWETATMSDRCLACHADITAQLQAPTSLHSLVRFGQTDLNCRTCHTEHRGPTASLTRIPPGWDPHDQLGFSLKTHRLRMDGAPFECKDCHENGFSGPFDQLTCATCHLKIDQVFAQEHILTFWTDCQACHDGLDSHGSKFDHNLVPFQLVGLHALTLCSQCHVNARNLHDLQATTQDCFACHQKDDLHLGQFGTKCGVCHTAEGWGKSAQFDHNLAAFKLTGLHGNVTCDACHINHKYKGAPSDCFSCHAKDDKHAGQFGTDCASCHIADGWNRAVDHSKFAFQLDGKHATVACESCHKNTDFKNTPTDCFSCHAKDDTHAGQFGAQCETCHTTTDWTSAAFDHNSVAFKLTAHQTQSDGTAFVCKDCHVSGYARPFDQIICANCHLRVDQAFASEHILSFWTNCMACHDGIDSHGSRFDHNLAPFNLIGKHAQTKCSSCHINDRTIADMQATSQDCYTCHQKDDFHNGQFGTSCGSCHTPEAWKPANIDHSKFAFHLDGKHSAVACESCHINGVFKGTPQDCASCHTKDDTHAGSLGALCGACHTPTGWKPATVDHSKFAFHLDGKHSTVACESCHINGVFKGTPQDCASCHTKDDAHAGSLGNQCGTCHNPSGWSPAIFDHNTVPFKLTAHQKKTDGTAFACKDCHVKGYAAPFDQNSCGNCHLQIDQAFSTEHFLTFGTNCMACHDGVESHGSNFDHNKAPFNLIGQHVAAKCSACHINARSLADLKAAPQDCFSCHEKDDNHQGQLGRQCEACHTPNGWKPATIDHSKFAFHLDGKHAAVACESCHKNGVFKGTPQDCASCHTKDDAHNGTLGNQCGTCHTPNGWTPASFDHNTVSFKLTAHQNITCKECHANGYAIPFNQNTCGNCHLQINQTFAVDHFLTFGTNCMACHDGVESLGSNFNHNLVPFKLSGKHGPVACSKCHIAARTIADLKSTPQGCVSCHLKDDQHNGQFGTDCSACHSTDGWELAKVDHSKFAFKLDGKHAAVACESCHKNGVFKGTPTDCASCHTEDDAHNGTLGSQCAVCHTPTGWKPSTFDHNNSAFQLTGKHASVTCQSCHINGVFKGAPTDCASCHTRNDPHAGKLGIQCAECHTTNGWKPSTFDHKNSSFQLTGKHTTVACAQCHKDKFFVGTPTACSSCHAGNDPHGGALGAQCATCHTTDGWKPSAFNHANSIFKLTGAHTTVACASCHKDLKFKGTPTTCYACHAANDHHGGKYGTNCAACHTTTAWKPATFDHNLSAFPLTGAHVNVSCTDCHANGIFVGAPKDCYSCHKTKDPHAGKAGTNCATCHTTTAWKPSTFKHTFPLTHGNNLIVACVTCHPSATSAYTCFSCHEHTVTNMADKHKEVRDYSQTTCAECHPNGRD